MLPQEAIEKFENEGFLVIENFISREECERIRRECENIIETNQFIEQVDKIPKFSDQGRDEYFLTSTDKIRAFLETKHSDIVDKKQTFNKIGHALHALNPVFKTITFSPRVKDLFKSIGYRKPIVCQSMYIFKQPYIGGEVVPHQDASYLHVEPVKLAGVWIALEDCTIENGCLSFIPGSHKGSLDTRFIRNPNKEEFNKGKYLIYTNDTPKYDDQKFIPVPVKAGSAILIDGLVVHKSGHNYSSKSRHIYTFHVYESENATFSKENWMEYSPISFLPL